MHDIAVGRSATGWLRATALLLVLAVIAGCASRPIVDGDGPPQSGSAIPPDLPPDPVPRHEPPSRYGNGPIYEVFGRPYRVLPTSEGYVERGVASWYGSKFHGRMTSAQEPYDMHALTAAHKTLPLPTYVRVRNLRNNKSVIVRVNDRGPFVDNRIIDLSYAAARRLDMVNDGTSLVEVTAINPGTGRQTGADVPADVPPDGGTTTMLADADTKQVYLQVGAFGERTNAVRRFEMLKRGGIRDAFVHRDPDPSRELYRVRIGPISDVGRYDTLVAQLQDLGIANSHLVSE